MDSGTNPYCDTTRRPDESRDLGTQWIPAFRRYDEHGPAWLELDADLPGAPFHLSRNFDNEAVRQCKRGIFRQRSWRTPRVQDIDPDIVGLRRNYRAPAVAA